LNQSDVESPREAQQTPEWSQRLLPLMSRMLVGLTVFFFLVTAAQLLYLHWEISQPPAGDFAASTSMLERVQQASGEALSLPAAAIATQTALERNAIERRYHQANVSLMSRVWTRYLGFATGMVLAMVGAVFILGRLQTAVSDVSASAAGSEISLKSESPGLILAGLGVLLMIVTILTHNEIDVKDSAIYAAGWSIQPVPPQARTRPAPFPAEQQETADEGPPASGALKGLLQEMDDDTRH
jgi:hypothetical protein